jgi:hypothetical protein
METLTPILQQYGIDPATIGAMIALVSLLLAAVKRYIKAVDGNISVIVLIVLSVLTGTLTSYTAGLISCVVSSFAIFIGATGGWELIKKAGGTQ